MLFYSVLPLNVPCGQASAIAEFITRANYGMALGNFELDFNDGEVRYKTSVDVTETEITSGIAAPAGLHQRPDDGQVHGGLMAVVYADVSPAEAVQADRGVAKPIPLQVVVVWRAREVFGTASKRPPSAILR